MNKLSRIEEEKQTITQMIHFYCRHKEKNQTLCSACSELLKYAHQRLEHCPFGERKKTCRQCTVHCYHPKMRQKNKRSHAFCGSSNDMVSPHLDSQTFVERAMTTVRLWIFSTTTCKIPQYIFIKSRLNLSDFQLIKHFCIFGTNLVRHFKDNDI